MNDITILYSDESSVGEALSDVVKEHGYTAENFNTNEWPDVNIRIYVYDSHATFVGISMDEFRERNLNNVHDMPLCTVSYDGTRAKLHFHEDVVQEDFWLRPAGLHAIDARQTPEPGKFAPPLEPVVTSIEEAFDVVSWDFSEVSAGSMATSGHFTDFEWEYVITGVSPLYLI